MACALQPWLWSRFPGLRPVVHTTAMRLGLALTGVLTLGMVLYGWMARRHPVPHFLETGARSGL